MAGYFNIGETKVRPGAYFNVQSNGDVVSYGAVDGVVAVLFQATMGEVGKAKVLSASEGYAKIYGTGGTTDAIREALYGGASKIVACRVGTGGTAASVELTAVTGKLKVTAKNAGAADYKVTVRTKLTDATKKEIVFYVGDTEIEKYSFTAAGDEVAAAIAAAAGSPLFALTAVNSGAGVITNVSQSALTGGVNPTVNSSAYSAALEEIEKYFFNVIVVDTEDASIHTLVAAFLDRIYDAGQFGMAVLSPDPTETLANRQTAAAAFNAENVIYPVNPKAYAGDTLLSGYQVAAYIGGLVAATPANRSVTHVIMNRYTALGELLTNTQIEASEEKGCIVLSTSNDGAVWLDNAINTLLHPDSNHDSGWKKIRRVKTRYELLYRANAAADDLVGQVDNDANGRATIATQIQTVCNAMVDEGKLQYAEVTESSSIAADGDTCGFDIDVIDKDSAEHIYLTYYFRFSTVLNSEE